MQKYYKYYVLDVLDEKIGPVIWLTPYEKLKMKDSNSYKNSSHSMNSQFCLNGKIALVTGASRGLGRYFSTLQARSGAKLAVLLADQLNYYKALRKKYRFLVVFRSISF